MQTIGLTRVTLIFVAISTWSLHSPAHEEKVHMKITEVAAASSPGLIAFLSDQLGKTDAPFTTRPLLRNDNVSFVPKANAPIEWLRQVERIASALF
jgi:hypothetical protein